jgi:DNA-3-methyladenine glycosylase
MRPTGNPALKLRPLPPSGTVASCAPALPRTFYARDPVTVALDMLGACLIHHDEGLLRIGRIVEVEAYLGPQDLAAHSSRGLTARTRVMFGPPGHAYVYLVYGLHCCMNVVTGPPSGSAVLLRAIEPLTGIPGPTAGPGLLCRAMRIDRRFDGHDLTLGTGLHLNVNSESGLVMALIHPYTVMSIRCFKSNSIPARVTAPGDSAPEFECAASSVSR